MKEVTQETLDGEIKNGDTVLIFTADWCGPCRLLLANAERAEQKLGDKVKFIFIDVDESQNANKKFGVVYLNLTRGHCHGSGDGVTTGG